MLSSRSFIPEIFIQFSWENKIMNTLALPTI